MPEPGSGAVAGPSIHWRQRWWYAFWVALLLGALGFWRWWETPAYSGVGHVVLTVRMADLPAGSRVSAWAGPSGTWRQDAAGFMGPWAVQDAARPLPVPPIEIKTALRRWHQGYIPRLTSDRVVLRIEPPQGPPRYAGYNLRADLNAGTAGPHRRLFLSTFLRWGALSLDASRPTPLLP